MNLRTQLKYAAIFLAEQPTSCCPSVHHRTMLFTIHIFSCLKSQVPISKRRQWSGSFAQGNRSISFSALKIMPKVFVRYQTFNLVHFSLKLLILKQMLFAQHPQRATILNLWPNWRNHFMCWCPSLQHQIGYP